jgi:hypothetical protein
MNKSKRTTSLKLGVRIALVIAALCLVCAPTGSAQLGPPADVAADAAMRAEIVDSVCAALNRTYVFPEVADQMDEFVRQQMAGGAYDDLNTVREFAGALTRDLQSISHDLHLRVGYIPPDMMAQLTADVDEDEAEARERAEAARDNFRFRRVEILTGNVGYLRFDGFVNAAYSGPTAVAAMNFLAHTDALIIDLRYNGGGSPSLIQLITTYFFDEPVHLNSFYIRESDSTQQFWTLTHVQGERMTDTDLYVLTSDRTFSGAEEFSYNLKNLERATIVGDTTGGGAHPVSRVIFEELSTGLGVPFGRAVNPITGTNWEGVGVIPDVAVPSAQALDKAHLMALETILEGQSDPRQAFAIEWAIAGLESKTSPVTVSPEVLASYAGSYGPRTLTLEDGSLIYQRGEGARMRAIPMGESMFRFDELDYFRIEIVTDDSGQPLKLIGHYDNGRTDESPRS